MKYSSSFCCRANLIWLLFNFFFLSERLLVPWKSGHFGVFVLRAPQSLLRACHGRLELSGEVELFLKETGVRKRAQWSRTTDGPKAAKQLAQFTWPHGWCSPLSTSCLCYQLQKTKEPNTSSFFSSFLNVFFILARGQKPGSPSWTC